MNILKLKKKPVIVEAVYFDGHNHADIKAFGGDKVNHIQASGSASDGTPGAREIYEQALVSNYNPNQTRLCNESCEPF